MTEADFWINHQGPKIKVIFNKLLEGSLPGVTIDARIEEYDLAMAALVVTVSFIRDWLIPAVDNRIKEFSTVDDGDGTTLICCTNINWLPTVNAKFLGFLDRLGLKYVPFVAPEMFVHQRKHRSGEIYHFCFEEVRTPTTLAKRKVAYEKGIRAIADAQNFKTNINF